MEKGETLYNSRDRRRSQPITPQDGLTERDSTRRDVPLPGKWRKRLSLQQQTINRVSMTDGSHWGRSRRTLAIACFVAADSKSLIGIDGQRILSDCFHVLKAQFRRYGLRESRDRNNQPKTILDPRQASVHTGKSAPRHLYQGTRRQRIARGARYSTFYSPANILDFALGDLARRVVASQQANNPARLQHSNAIPQTGLTMNK